MIFTFSPLWFSLCLYWALSLIPFSFFFPSYQFIYSLLFFILCILVLPFPGADIFKSYIPLFNGELYFSTEPLFSFLVSKNILFGGNYISFYLFVILVSLPLIYRSFHLLCSGLAPHKASLSFGIFCLISGPVIFYHSPRSALPFALLFVSLVLSNDSKVKSSFCAVLAPFLHLQALPYTFIVLIYNSLSFKRAFKKFFSSSKFLLVFTFLFSLLLFIFVSFLPSVLSVFSSALSERASAKLLYISSVDVRIRASSLFTFLVVLFSTFTIKPLPSFYYFRNILSNFPLLRIFLFFAFSIQVIFFTNPHISSRLSRPADYIILPIILASLLPSNFSKHVTFYSFLLLFLSLLITFVYPSVFYNFSPN